MNDMEKTKGEQLQEELMMKMVNGTTRLSDEEIDKAYDYAEGYKKYMDAAKSKWKQSEKLSDS